MNRFPHCRLLIDAVPQSGAWNMAVDEALLESAVAGGLPTVRWYRWAKPTVSLGYFQPLEAAGPWCECDGVDVVRRLTGGGAIVHHQEWTYSVTLPTLSPLLRHSYELYDLAHEVFRQALERRFGLRLLMRGATRRFQVEPALCYQREDEHDVCYNGVKVIGSAQRRRRGALLQHGSILLGESAHAPGIRGLRDLAPEVAGRLRTEDDQLARDLAANLAEHAEEGKLSTDERAVVDRLVLERYSPSPEATSAGHAL